MIYYDILVCCMLLVYWLSWVYDLGWFGKKILCIARFASKKCFTCLFQATPRKRFRWSHHHRCFAQRSHDGSFGFTKCNGGGSASYSSTCSTARCQTRSNACDVGSIWLIWHTFLHYISYPILSCCLWLHLTRSTVETSSGIPFDQSRSFLNPSNSFRVKLCKALWELFQQMVPSWTRHFQLTEQDFKVVTPWQLSRYHQQSFYYFVSKISRFLCCVFWQCKLTQHTQHGSTCIFTDTELDSVLDCLHAVHANIA